MSTAQKTWDRVYIEYLAVFSVGWLDMNTSLILDPPPIPFSENCLIQIKLYKEDLSNRPFRLCHGLISVTE